MDSKTLMLLPAVTASPSNRASALNWQLFAPALGMAASTGLGLLSWPSGASPAAIYACFSLGMALVYLALVPSCEQGGRAALVLALGQGALGLLCWQSPTLLHAGLGLQTVIAALWLLREQPQGERAMAGLMLGLSTGAVVGLGFALAP